ncbi:MAG: hypothetical protein R3256_06695 [Thalassovita sp.]|nr:hypothetical protein [Thalassovita sp.]
MKPLLVAALTASLAQPVLANDQGSESSSEDEDGLSLMEEGARLFFRGIMQEMEPAIDEMQRFSEELEPALRQFTLEMGPALRDLMEKVDDITMYHPPELLPNGDIILRRKTPLTPEPAPEGDSDDGAIDL